MLQNLLEKLQYTEQKNILVQGLPSSIEKQFAKINFAKNVTPLMRARRIDFALVFTVNVNQLCGILNEVLPALHDECIFWIASPKTSSKIATDLSRACSWDHVHNAGYEPSAEVTLDHVWTATRFVRKAEVLKLPRNSVKHTVLQES